MQKRMERMSSEDCGRLGFAVLCALSLLFVLGKAFAILFGGNVRLVHDLLAICVLCAWCLRLFFSARPAMRRRAAASALALALLLPISRLDVAETRFLLYRDAFEVSARAAYERLKGEENAFFLQMDGVRPELGEVRGFKVDGAVVVCFAESASTFDYFCYARSFAGQSPADILPEIPQQQRLEDNWYYVNLY